MTTPLVSIYLALKDLAEPVLTRFSGLEALEYLFYRYGWNVALDDPSFAQIDQALAFKAPLMQFLQTAESIEQKLDANPDADLSAGDIASLAQSALMLIDALRKFQVSNLAGLAGPLGTADFWENIGEQLLDDLLEEYLRIYQPSIYLVLHFCGAIRYEPTGPDGPSRIQYQKIVFDWHQLLAVLQDPVAGLKQTYKWGDPNAPFEYQRFFEALANVLRAIGLATNWFAPGLRAAVDLRLDSSHQIHSDLDGLATTFLYGLVPHDQIFYEIGMELFPAARSGQQVPSGLMFRPVVSGGAEGQLSLSDSLSMQWKAGATSGDLVQFFVFPDKVGVALGQPTVDASLQIAGTRTDPWYLIGTPRSARIELYSPSLRLAVEGSAGDPEATLHLGAAAATGQPGCKLVVPLDDADAFVKDAAAQNAIQVGFTPEIIWSSRSGFSFNGSPTPSITLPASVSLGPITIQNVRVRVAQEPDGTTSNPPFAFRAGVDISGDIGPIKFVIQDVGFAFDVIPYTHQEVLALPPGADKPVIGNLGIALRFAAPSGVGLAIDVSGLTGGGFLFHDEAAAQYAGMLQLAYQQFQLQAFGLIATKLPTGPGYSLIAMIDANFPPIELVAGFTLNGVGGLFGIHRTFSKDALQAALKAHTLSNFLFTKNPVANAAQILTDLETFFPAANGRYVFGPLLQIGWGTPTLITIDLALILELPDPVRLLLLGELAVLLPEPDAVLIELHMDVLGTIDFGTDEGSLDAVLHDSRLVGYPLHGAMALRGCWAGGDKTFLLAVGGFHPAFQPPPSFPTLDRLSISMPSGPISKLNLSGYLAVTSNTLQIGANLSIFVGIDGFGISGYLNFDALLEREPKFHFEADISGGITLSVDGHDVMSLDLSANMSGPAPWHVAGHVHFHLLFIGVTKSFSATFGDAATDLPVEQIDVGLELRAAFADPRNFTVSLTTNENGLVSLRVPDAPGMVLGHPSAGLKIDQRVVPLGLAITRFGSAAPLGDTIFNITAITVDGIASQTPLPVVDDFAPAQFLSLSDDDELSSPSFQPYAAGASLAEGAITFGRATMITAAIAPDTTFDTWVIDNTEGGLPHKRQTSVLPDGLWTILRGLADTGSRRYAAPSQPMVRAPLSYVVATTDQIAVSDVGSATGQSYAQARTAMAAALAQNANRRGTLQIVPRYEVS